MIGAGAGAADGAGDRSLVELVAAARQGDAHALNDAVAAVRDDVYGLAMRMLWHPEDAADATQEILTKVVVGLDSFRAESAFRTWVYRIAANHLLTTRKRRVERQRWTFGGFAADLADGLDPAAAPATDPDQRLLEEDVKIGCTQAMLQCLDREHRLAYILGEVFSLPAEQAAEITATTPVAHRKRLSRARGRIRSFMATHCGLVSPAAACRCAGRVGAATRSGRLDPASPQFAGHPRRDHPRRDHPTEQVAEMERLHAAAAIFRSHPRYTAPDRVAAAVTELLARPGLRLLEHTGDHTAPPAERTAPPAAGR